MAENPLVEQEPLVEPVETRTAGDWQPSQALRDVAELDFDRAERRGYPEAV